MSEKIVPQITKAGKTRIQYGLEITASRLRICQQCGKEYVKKRRHLNEGNKYCSRACSGAAISESAEPKYSKIYFNTCVVCEKQWVDRKHKRCCSGICDSRMRWVTTLPNKKMCACCGVEFKPVYGRSDGASMNFCSDDCIDSTQRAIKLKWKIKRKSLLRRVTIETVDPFKVFDRDGWRCKLCGIKTPKAKRGTYDDNAPELDHILPLAKGGEHSYLNTQCACRKCNATKSDKPLGQLLMFG